MNIMMLPDSPAPVLAPPAAPVPPANTGLPLVAGSDTGNRAATMPFDVALQACLIDLPGADGVAGDVPVGKGRAEGDDAATPSSGDEAPSSAAQGLPVVLLMALLPPPQGMPQAAQAAQAVQTADPAATTATNVLPGLSRQAANPDSNIALRSASQVSSGAMPTVAQPQPLSISVGDGAGTPLPAAVLLAAQGLSRPQPSSAARVAPAPVSAPLQAVQPMPTLASASVDAEPVAATAAAAVVGPVTPGEAGRASPAEGADQMLLASVPPLAAADAGAARSPDAPLRLANGEPSQWRQPLMQALGERLQVVTERGIDSALIRLEPPRMGSIEIAIRHQDGALQVNLSATHNEVLRQLQDISDNLRHSLGQRHAGEVTVQVADTASSRPGQGDGERQRQRQAQSEQNPGRALGEAEADGGPPSFRLARNEE